MQKLKNYGLEDEDDKDGDWVVKLDFFDLMDKE